VTIRGDTVKVPPASCPSEQTLVLKPVSKQRKEMLERFINQRSKPTNLHSKMDDDQTIPGALLMYVNYATVDETLRAKQLLEDWLEHKSEWSNRPVVARKICFRMHVSGLPGDATTSAVESFFSQFGSFSHVLHDCNYPLTWIVARALSLVRALFLSLSRLKF
jgi:hypothetical protein